MTQRTVFKLAGSFGPGGTIAIFTEKLLSAIYYDAY